LSSQTHVIVKELGFGADMELKFGTIYYYKEYKRYEMILEIRKTHYLVMALNGTEGGRTFTEDLAWYKHDRIVPLLVHIIG
jgi:hypothetical protein